MTVIVVEHRDRLARLLSVQSRRIVVLDEAEGGEDLVCEVTEVLALMCARLYRRRSAAKRATVAVKAAEAPPR